MLVLLGLLVASPAAVGSRADGGETVQPPTPVISGPVVQLEDVEVLGSRGAARMPPEIALGAEDIDVLDAYDVREVIERLNQETGAGEPPVILINGQKVAIPGIYLDFPPDALVRVEVLPPAAAGLYGAPPSARVVNAVFKSRFDSRDASASASRPTTGGLSTVAGDARLSAIAEGRTFQAGVKGERRSALRAGERPGAAARTGDDIVTLRPASTTLSANISHSRPLGDWNLALNARARNATSRPIAVRDDEVVRGRNRALATSLTAGLSGDLHGWSVQSSATASASETVQDGLSDVRSDSQSLALELSADRGLFEAPAGSASATLRAQFAASRSVTDGALPRRRFSGQSGSFGGDFRIPLLRSARQGEDEGGAHRLGDVSLSFGAAARHSDYGGGESINAALAWTPRRRFNLNASWRRSVDAPSDESRYAPLTFGDPVVVYDFQNGMSVEVTPILGGNPDLRPTTLELSSLTLSTGPFTRWSLFGNFIIQQTEAADGAGTLPVPTPELEAAFPDRFQRNDDGLLVAIDQRPINIRSAQSNILSSNLTFNLPRSAVRAGGNSGRRGRTVRVSLGHNWRLSDTTIIRAGLPAMDRLAGDGGGSARHDLNARVDVRDGPWGLNLAGTWRSGYRIRRDSGRDGPDDLKIGTFSAVNLGLTHRLNDGAKDADGERGAGDLQLELEVENVFDTRPTARLGDGRPAPGYGRDDQDPVGRTIRLTLKSRF